MILDELRNRLEFADEYNDAFCIARDLLRLCEAYRKDLVSWVGESYVTGKEEGYRRVISSASPKEGDR